MGLSSTQTSETLYTGLVYEFAVLVLSVPWRACHTRGDPELGAKVSARDTQRKRDSSDPKVKMGDKSRRSKNG